MLAYTGIRWGESAGLRVRNVNELRRRLSVEEDYPSFFEARLTRPAQGKPAGAFFFGDGSKPLLIPHSFHGWFNNAVKSMHAVDDTFPRVTLHDLRHTAASLAISAGANVNAVQRTLGHASAAMTLATYADLFEVDLDGVAVRLGDAAREAG